MHMAVLSDVAAVVVGDASALAAAGRVDASATLGDEVAGPLPPRFVDAVGRGDAGIALHIPAGRVSLPTEPIKVLPTMTDEMAAQVWSRARRLLAPIATLGAVTVWTEHRGDATYIEFSLEAFGRGDTEEGRAAMTSVRAQIEGKREPYATLSSKYSASSLAPRYASRTKQGVDGDQVLVGVAVAGILAAIAIPAMTKYLRLARTSEANVQLARMVDALVAYYAEHGQCPNGGEALAPTPPKSFDCNVGPGGRCAPGSVIDAGRYDPTLWETRGWKDLGFSMDTGHYFHYSMVLEEVDGSCKFTAVAEADLDGDTTEFSRFARSGVLRQGGNEVDELVVTDEVE